MPWVSLLCWGTLGPWADELHLSGLDLPGVAVLGYLTGWHGNAGIYMGADNAVIVLGLFFQE